jgi:hypothetical protein
MNRRATVPRQPSIPVTKILSVFRVTQTESLITLEFKLFFLELLSPFVRSLRRLERDNSSMAPNRRRSETYVPCFL